MNRIEDERIKFYLEHEALIREWASLGDEVSKIEDERVKFYLEHEAFIREWASLGDEVSKLADRFYRSLKNDLDEALGSGGIADDGVESFFDGTDSWRGVGFRRQDWPQGRDEPHVRLEWSSKSTRFSPDGHLIIGVRTTVERYRRPFTKERCPGYPRQGAHWPASARVEPPAGRFWEGDNLKEYRDRLVKTILKAWEDLAPLVDEAVVKDPGR